MTRLEVLKALRTGLYVSAGWFFGQVGIAGLLFALGVIVLVLAFGGFRYVNN